MPHRPQICEHEYGPVSIEKGVTKLEWPETLPLMQPLEEEYTPWGGLKRTLAIERRGVHGENELQVRSNRQKDNLWFRNCSS